MRQGRETAGEPPQSRHCGASRASSGILSGRPLVRCLVAALLLSTGLLLQLAGPARAEPIVSPAQHPSSPAKLQDLLTLLADPEIQAFLNRHTHDGIETPAQTAPPKTMAIGLADRLQGLRSHLMDLGAAARTLPIQAGQARDMVAASLDQRGWLSAGLLFAVFVGLGFGTEWLFSRIMQPFHAWLKHLKLETVNERVRAVFARLAYGLGLVVSFALGSIGAFLAFDWPVVLREFLLSCLVAFLTVRVCAVVGRFLLAPGAPRFRVIPVTTEGASFLYRRWLTLALLTGVGWQGLEIFSRYGLSRASAELCGDLIGLVILLIGLETVWRAPWLELDPTVETRAAAFAERHHSGIAMGVSCLLVLLWALWVIKATQAFWLVGIAAGVPAAIVVARRSVNHVLRPAGSNVSLDEAKALDVVIFERGVRAIIIVGAALLLGSVLGIDFVSLTMRDTLSTRLIRAAVNMVVIGLLADFLWHVIRALIDRKLTVSLARADTAEDAGHTARLQTLLPIVSNILLIVIVVVSAMMMLAAAGVEIAPLIASAGVVGVAIGFGAQTLVKDIISGIFYLFDDAFRIGEYIQSGTFKGTVESFSLRSIKLRHQRGALYTVPFGILGAVQNQSRDWVVDKIVMNVPYGTDLEKVRKLIKRIGESLAEDPEFGPEIINPLKMQGVVQFGDFAIQIQTKMMTKPGDVQFMARRRALLMINAAFAENGIGFAMPMVHVAGEAASAAAAAQKGFELLRQAGAE